MKLGNELVKLLIEYGVKHVFGVPGGQTLQLYRGIMQSSGRVEHVLMRDERSAGFAADAYARITGQTGICDATVGPGATNLVSPLAEAYSSSIPIIAILSDIPHSWEHLRIRGNASQAVNQVDLFRSISKWQTTLTDPQALHNVVDTAFRIANTGRPGPVVLSIPEDIFTSSISNNKRQLRTLSARFPWHRVAPNPKNLKEAVRLIREAKKPALFVGGGALISGAFDQVKTLAEKLSAPVATTLSGKGVLEDTHPFSIGIAGRMGNPLANDILQEADLIIFIGTKAGQVATLGWNIPHLDIPIIHIDIDPEEIGRNFPKSLPLVSDARLALNQLNEALGNENLQKDWVRENISQRARVWYEESVRIPQGEGAILKPQTVMDIVNKFINEEDLAVCDASFAAGWAAVYLRLTQPGRRYIAPRGLAGLGWGAPAAIGASLATNAKKRILLFAGDGGFAYSVQELEVISRLKLPIVTIIFNNDTLAWIKHLEKERFKKEYISVDFQHVDFATVAEGFGVHGYRVHTIDELTSIFMKVRSSKEPIVIDIITDQWETPLLGFSLGE